MYICRKLAFLTALLAMAGTLFSRPAPAEACGVGPVPTDPFERMLEFTGSSTVNCDQLGLNPPAFFVPTRGDWYQVQRDYLFQGNRTGRLGSYCVLTLTMGEEWPSVAELIDAGVVEEPDPLLIVDGVEGPPGYSVYSSRIVPDYLALLAPTPEYGGMSNAYWPYHYRRFMTSIGAFEASTLVSALPPPQRPPRLAILDSAPTSSTPGWTLTADHRDHGVALARMAEEMLCEQGDSLGPCLASVVSVQALGRNPAYPSAGSLGDLAMAIKQAIEDAPSPDRLTITLPLGWVHPALGGHLGDIFDAVPAGSVPETVGAGALHEVFEYAACVGTLIIGSTGNRVGLHDRCYEEEAIRPAHWASHTITAAECASQFNVTAGYGGARPLVMTVGATNDHNQRLGVHRQLSFPDVYANGMAAVAPIKTLGNQPTAQLYGTSASSIVASALSVILQHRNGSTKAIMMRELLAPTGGPISLYDYVRRHFEDYAAVVSPPARLAPHPTKLGLQPDDSAQIPNSGNVQPCTLPSGEHIEILGGSANDCLLLSRSSADEAPFTHQTPLSSGGGPCPSCTVSMNSLSAVTANVMAPSQATNFEMHFVELNTAGSIHLYALPSPMMLVPGTTYQIPLNLPPGVTFNPATTTARIIGNNDTDATLLGFEIYVNSTTVPALTP